MASTTQIYGGSTVGESEPKYDPETDTMRQIHRGHDNASAVTSSDGVTVFFDPDTDEVLGFSIANFKDFYEKNKDDDGEWNVSIPTRVPSNLEEEMDFDEEAIRKGVRIAEIY